MMKKVNEKNNPLSGNVCKKGNDLTDDTMQIDVCNFQPFDL
jgi:hypothetical protein